MDEQLSIDTARQGTDPASANHDATHTDNAVLRFENWGYRHASRRHFAVRGLNITIEAGQRVLLLGASGIGKSTILEGAAGLLGGEENAERTEMTADGTMLTTDAEGGVTEGRVLVDDVPVTRARGRIGLVLQDPDAQANLPAARRQRGVRSREPQRCRGTRSGSGCATVCVRWDWKGFSCTVRPCTCPAGRCSDSPWPARWPCVRACCCSTNPRRTSTPDGVTQVVDAVRDVLGHLSFHDGCLVEHRAGPWIDMIDRVVVLGLETDEQQSARIAQQGDEEEVDRGGFKRTVVVADGTPDEVFRDPGLDFAELGIWLPDRYRRPEDEIVRIHTDDEPPYDPSVGTGQVLLSARDLSHRPRWEGPSPSISTLDFTAGQITALVRRERRRQIHVVADAGGLLEPVRGQVQASAQLAADADGDAPIAWKSTELASRISYVFQNPEHQFARGSVLEEVMLGPLRTGCDEAEAERRARELLTRFRLIQYAQQNPYTLSGGEKRRLTVASALAAAPRVLILDEPTFGQDRRTWMQIVRLIHGLRGDGVSIIVVTHDRELVTALGARLVELTPSDRTGEWTASGASDPRIPVSPVNERVEDPKPSSRSPFLGARNPRVPADRRVPGLAADAAEPGLGFGHGGAGAGAHHPVVHRLTPWRVVKSTCRTLR